tara:strand:+ start:150 stop:440 length:291 start_codon:yes stop_codon:yes gene_type:complete
MVLCSTAIILLNNRRVIDNFINIEDSVKTINNNIYIIVYIGLLLLFTTIPAVLVAINCNKNNKVLYALVGFLFSDIYLLQWSIKKFILKSENYCNI